MRLIWYQLWNRYYRWRCSRRKLPRAAARNLKALSFIDRLRALKDVRFAAIDLETTGLEGDDDIISIGAVRIRRGRIDLGDTFNCLVNPEKEISKHAVVVHEILPSSVVDKPAIEEVLPSFLDWLGHDVVVSHYARIDKRYLDRDMRRLYGFPLQNITLDIISLRCKIYELKNPCLSNHRITPTCSLEGLAKEYDLPVEERHTALGDAVTTAVVFICLLKELESMGRLCLKELIRLCAVI